VQDLGDQRRKAVYCSSCRGVLVKVRLSVAVVAAAVIGSLVVPAHATPYAGQFRYLDSGTLAIKGADGARWLLALGATQSGSFESRAEQRLYIDLSRCVGSRCDSVAKWSRPLTASEVSITPGAYPTINSMLGSSRGTAHVRTVLGGMDLDLTLQASTAGPGYGFGGLGTSTTPPGFRPQVGSFQSAGGSLRLAGLTCQVGAPAGTIGEIEGVDTLGDDARDPRTAPPATLPAGFLKGKRAAHC
jgi:hypothetical protein